MPNHDGTNGALHETAMNNERTGLWRRRRRGGWRRASEHRGMLLPSAGVMGLLSVIGVALVHLSSVVDGRPYPSAMAFFVSAGVVAALLVAIRWWIGD